MLTAYDTYRKSHELLFVAESREQLDQATRATVENFLENRAIWRELFHYREKNSLLGEHPIFSWMKKQEEIRRLRIPELVNLKIRLENNLVRLRAKIRTQPDNPNTLKRKSIIASHQRELAEVNRLLSI